MLLGQHGADQAGDGVTVGEDPDDVGAAADLPVQPFLRVVRPDLAPDLLGEAGEREHVGAGAVEIVGDRGELVGQGVQDPVVLSVHGVGVGLVVDRVQQRLHPAPAALRCDRHEVGGVVSSTPLPRGAGKVRCDGLDQPGVGVGGDQQHPGQTPGHEVGEERMPGLLGFAGSDLDPEDLPVAVTVDPGGDEHDGVDDPAVLTDLHRQRIRRHEGERPGLTQGAGPKRGHLLVKIGGHPRDLGLRQARDAQGLHELVHPGGSRPPAGNRSPPPRSAPTRPVSGARAATRGSTTPT